MLNSTPANILVAYPYFKKESIKLVAEHKELIRFVLDSGAFTAWKAGNTISLDEYCNFIEKLPFDPWKYFTLDVVGDPKKTLENYNIMLKRGFKPLPIFTRGEDISLIDEYYKTSDVLGIGGLVGTKGSKGFVKAIMKKIGNRRVHWLGFTNKEFVKHYKPFMCDSSSWRSGARYGSFNLYCGNSEYLRLNRVDFKNKPSLKACNVIKSYGYDPVLLSKNENWLGGRSLNEIINAQSAVREVLDIEKHLGVKKFNACATNIQVDLVIEAYKREVL